MFEDIKKNKIKSAFIVFLFLAFISVIVYYICMALNLGEMSIIIALIFAIISTWGSYYYSDKIVLSLNKARPATKEEDLKLVNILDALVVSSGLPAKPRLYVVEDAQPNAFATGRNPQNAVICVTTGLLDKLEYYDKWITTKGQRALHADKKDDEFEIINKVYEAFQERKRQIMQHIKKDDAR